MKIPNPVLLIIIAYFTAQTMISTAQGIPLSGMLSFFYGSAFLFITILIVTIWTGDLFVEYRPRRNKQL